MPSVRKPYAELSLEEQATLRRDIRRVFFHNTKPVTSTDMYTTATSSAKKEKSKRMVPVCSGDIIRNLPYYKSVDSNVCYGSTVSMSIMRATLKAVYECSIYTSIYVEYEDALKMCLDEED